MDLSIFDRLESEVRSYIRSFPRMLDTARGSVLTDVDGVEHIDFFCGAGAVNSGDNDPDLKRAVIEFLGADKLQHALDMATGTKARFLESFERRILAPRGLDHRVQFTGPTGANTVEAALKLARLATGRTRVVAFTHGYHGLSLGALAATANQWFRQASGTPLNDVVFHPYDGYYGDGIDTVALLRRHLEDPSSGMDLPAAVIVECVQGEGGVNVASVEWLRALRELCTEHGIVLIADEIQIGVGRSGDFFGFERSGIRPDLITLSKSLSGQRHVPRQLDRLRRGDGGAREVLGRRSHRSPQPRALGAVDRGARGPRRRARGRVLGARARAPAPARLRARRGARPAHLAGRLRARAHHRERGRPRRPAHRCGGARGRWWPRR